MRTTDIIQSLAITISLVLSSVSLYWQWQDEVEHLEIIQAEGGGGNFYVTGSGVVQEVEFHLINNQTEPVILRQIQITPNSAFPAPVLIDGVLWDGRPIRIDGQSVVVAKWLAMRDFEVPSSYEQLISGGQLSNPFREAVFEAELTNLAPSDLDADVWGREQLAGTLGLGVFSSNGAEDVQKQLYSKGFSFLGQFPDIAEELGQFDMFITFGGPCFNYLAHTLSVCTSLEVSTTEGNAFHSEYVGFGLRSPDLDQAYREKT